MTEETRRRRLRATFEEVPEPYDEARPLYPPQVFDDLVELVKLDPGARILELGPGTGQATLPLAERGWIDPDSRYGKTARLLRGGGALAVVSTKHVLRPDGDRQALYTRIRERMGGRNVFKTLLAILNVARRL